MSLDPLLIDSLEATGKRYTIIDKETRGLSLRVGETGTKTWYFRGTVRGKVMNRPLGTYPAMMLRTARKEARLIYDGGVHYPSTFSNLEEMVVAYFRGTKARKSDIMIERSLKKHPWGAAKGMFSILPDEPDEVRPADVAHYVDILKSRTTLADGSIKNFLSFMRRVYAFHMLRGRVPSNPFAVFLDLNRTLRGQDQVLKANVPRQGVLSDGQIGTGLDQLDGEWLDYYRVLLLTGCRREELRSLHASEICLASGTINFPAARKKNRRPHTLALSTLARAIIEPRLRGGGYIFPERRSFVSQSLGWRFRKVMDCSPHEIRRTVSRQLNALGCPLRIVAKVLSHSPKEEGVGQVTMTYTNETNNPRIEEQRVWLQKLADYYTEKFPGMDTIHPLPVTPLLPLSTGFSPAS